MLNEKTLTGETLTLTLSRELGQLLTAAGMTIGTAESCTGGLIAGAITEIAGSSGWFEHGVVTYSNASKMAMLGVDHKILERHGAVSEACVMAMASGTVRRFGVDVALSVSGIAGPGGATQGKPVGTVWIGWALRSRSTSVSENSGTLASANMVVEAAAYLFTGDRSQVREQAVHQALRGTISRMDYIGTKTP